MIPLADELPQRRFPIVNATLIAVNFVVFVLYELPNMNGAILHASFYPATLTGWHGPEPWEVSWITAMFLHAGWSHLLGNMLFLLVFGNDVERAFGRLRYLGFYFAGGFAAMLMQAAMTLLFSTAAAARVPCLGASGAIAAVLGAYFVLYPDRASSCSRSPSFSRRGSSSEVGSSISPSWPWAVCWRQRTTVSPFSRTSEASSSGSW